MHAPAAGYSGAAHSPGMMPQMILDKCGDKKITVVIAFLHPQRQ
jgi:hypothetical protein